MSTCARRYPLFHQALVVMMLLCLQLLSSHHSSEAFTPSILSRSSSTSARRPSIPLRAVEKEEEKDNNNVKNDDEESSSFFFNIASKETTTKSGRSTRAVEEESSSRGGEMVKQEFFVDVLEAVWTVGSEIARESFFALRRTAANALTASLPENEREELLERTMGKQRVAIARQQQQQQAAPSAEEEDDDYAASMSVQENLAAAKIKDIQQLDPELWQKEKDAIYKEAEQAAKERVETELAIQKARMDKERQQMNDQVTEAQQQIQDEKDKLQALKIQIAKEKDALLSNQQQGDAASTSASAALQEEQKAKITAMEEALQQKEGQAKIDQEKIEQLEQKLFEAQQPQASSSGSAASGRGTTSIIDDDDDETETETSKAPSPSLPRIRAGRYTPEEWRSLTDEEKEQVQALREELGPAAMEKVWEEGSTTPSSSSAADADVHPILGPVLHDFGYKRIHVLSVGKLGTIPIWKKQRIYRHDRAKAMVEDKWRSMSLGLPGIICLHENTNDGKLAIIDGQHRVGMMILLRDKQRKYLQQSNNNSNNPEGDGGDDNPAFPPIDFDRVLVEVYPSSTTSAYGGGDVDNDDDVEQHAQNLFLEINKAEPVKLIDMPGVAKAKDRQIITQAVEKLYEAYPAMFSPSQRCRIPNVNVDNLRNSLFGSGCIRTHKLTTTKKLYNWILEQNESVGNKYNDNSEEEQSNINPRAWKKASENKFYLGLESTWLYN